MTNYRTHFRLGWLLHAFKDMTEDRRLLKELKSFGKVAGLHREAEYEGFLTAYLYDKFEDLFTSAEGRALDLEELSGRPMDVILLDCLMYQVP